MSIFTTHATSAHTLNFLETRLIFGGLGVNNIPNMDDVYDKEDLAAADADERLEAEKSNESEEVTKDIRNQLKEYGLKIKDELKDIFGDKLIYENGGNDNNTNNDYLVRPDGNAYKVTDVTEKSKEQKTKKEQKIDNVVSMEELPSFKEINSLLSETGANIEKHENGMFDIVLNGNSLYKNLTLARDKKTNKILFKLGEGDYVNKEDLVARVKAKSKEQETKKEVIKAEPTFAEINSLLSENGAKIEKHENGMFDIIFNGNSLYKNLTLARDKKTNKILFKLGEGDYVKNEGYLSKEDFVNEIKYKIGIINSPRFKVLAEKFESLWNILLRGGSNGESMEVNILKFLQAGSFIKGEGAQIDDKLKSVQGIIRDVVKSSSNPSLKEQYLRSYEDIEFKFEFGKKINIEDIERDISGLNKQLKEFGVTFKKEQNMLSVSGVFSLDGKPKSQGTIDIDHYRNDSTILLEFKKDGDKLTIVSHNRDDSTNTLVFIKNTANEV